MSGSPQFSSDPVENEIQDLGRQIDHAEFGDPLYVDHRVRELRHRVMYVHARLEASLGILIWRWILESGRQHLPKDIRQAMGSRFDMAIGEADFARKVTFAQENGLISGKMKDHLFAVNNLRVIFSHPKAHEVEITNFSDLQTHVKALRTLKNGLDEMNEVFAEIERNAKSK